MKKGKSAGVNNIPAELVQAGGEDVITALTTICNKIWQTGKWPTPWTQSLVITLPKKGNLQQCQNYRMISLSHPHKVMLKIVLNRLKPQVEKIIAEEQAGFRARQEHRRDLQPMNPPSFALFKTQLQSALMSWDGTSTALRNPAV